MFLATLAHELRNPLAPIRQAAQIARSETASPAQRLWGLGVIDRQAAHMALLLDDLLDVSRITRGQLVLRRVYRFEFSDDGSLRRSGQIVMLSGEVESLTMEPFLLQ